MTKADLSEQLEARHRLDLIDRFDVFQALNHDMQIKAELFKHLLLCNLLNQKGIEYAASYLEIIEKYGVKKQTADYLIKQV